MWFRTSAKNRRAASAPARRTSFRLELERLEDRAVPASLSYSSYLPGPAWAVAVDASGDTYLTGAYASNGNGANSKGVYVAKVNATGTGLDWLTNLSSSGFGTGIALDAAGDVYVTGTGSVPTTAGALGTSGSDFFSVLSPDGSTVLYSTLLPGSTVGNFGAEATPWGASIALGPSGAGPLDNAYITGEAGAGLLTTAGAFQPNSGGGNDAFFADINPNLSGTAGLVYGAYLGGSGNDVGTGIAVDASGNAYITGATYSTNFPTTAGAFQRTSGGSEDAFVSKINPSLSGPASLVYSTYLGGSTPDGYTTDLDHDAASPVEPGPHIAVDSSGDAYVAGGTNSTNFPTTPGAFQTSFTGGTLQSDAFVTKLNATGTGLVYSTYLGGSATKKSGAYSGAFGVAVDASGDADVTGWTRSTNFPTLNPLQSANAGGSDVFVTTLNAAGSGLLFSTYFGGSSDDFGYAVALDSAGDAYVVGKTESTNFPTTAGAYQTSPGTGFVFEIDPPAEGGAAASPLMAVLSSGAPVVFTGGGMDGVSGTTHGAADTLAAFMPGDVAPAAGLHPFLGDLAGQLNASDGAAGWSAADLAFLPPFDALLYGGRF